MNKLNHTKGPLKWSSAIYGDDNGNDYTVDDEFDIHTKDCRSYSVQRCDCFKSISPKERYYASKEWVGGARDCDDYIIELESVIDKIIEANQTSYDDTEFSMRVSTILWESLE